MSATSKDAVHGFSIPHDAATLTGDTIIVRVPQPPEKIGLMYTPATWRDLAQHNVVAGKIIKFGPLAFSYKDADGGVKRTDVQIGDWVVFRPFAGTLIQPDGRVGAVGGVRYLSSFRDVLAAIPAAAMSEAEAVLANESREG